MPRHMRRAVTLVELVIVILMIGIAAAVAQPRFSGALMHYRADAAAQRIVADLDYAATLARVSSRPVILRFIDGDGAGAHYYRFEAVADPNVPGRRADAGDQSTWYTVILSDQPYAATIRSAPSSLEYDMYGFPDKDASIAVQVGSEIRTVGIFRGSGKASVQ